MSKKIPSKLSGRAVADDKGNQRWVWDSEGSEGKNVDTALVRALGEELTLEGSEARAKTHGSNPYDRGGTTSGPSTPGSSKAGSSTAGSSTPGEQAPAKRRTLDDMRKLSESIKRNKRTT